MDKKTRDQIVRPIRLTEEEKRQQIAQILIQKREQFAINILCSLLHNNPGIHPEDVITKAVKMADALMEKLYPIKEDNNGKQD